MWVWLTGSNHSRPVLSGRDHRTFSIRRHAPPERPKFHHVPIIPGLKCPSHLSPRPSLGAAAAETNQRVDDDDEPNVPNLSASRGSHLISRLTSSASSAAAAAAAPDPTQTGQQGAAEFAANQRGLPRRQATPAPQRSPSQTGVVTASSAFSTCTIFEERGPSTNSRLPRQIPLLFLYVYTILLVSHYILSTNSTNARYTCMSPLTTDRHTLHNTVHLSNVTEHNCR